MRFSKSSEMQQSRSTPIIQICTFLLLHISRRVYNRVCLDWLQKVEKWSKTKRRGTSQICASWRTYLLHLLCIPTISKNSIFLNWATLNRLSIVEFTTCLYVSLKEKWDVLKWFEKHRHHYPHNHHQYWFEYTLQEQTHLFKTTPNESTWIQSFIFYAKRMQTIINKHVFTTSTRT